MTKTQRAYVNCILHALWLVLIAFPDPTVADPPQCYFNDGSQAPSDYRPCNSSVQAGAHSPCCILGTSPGNSEDYCLTTGLCFWQKATESTSFVFASGCTDQTGKDPSCQQVCTSGIALTPRTSLFLPLLIRRRPQSRDLRRSAVSRRQVVL